MAAGEAGGLPAGGRAMDPGHVLAAWAPPGDEASGGATTDEDSEFSEDASSGTSESDFRLADLSLASPGILRATTAAVPLARLGRLLRRSMGGVVARGDCKDHYVKSFATGHFDEFWSHSWHGESWQKVCTLLIYYNSVPGLAAGCTAAALGASTQFLGLHMNVEQASLMTLLLGTLGFTLATVFWRSPRRVFLDSVCICQADAELKAQGIVSLGGFLRHSRAMLLLWDASYCGRLWCVFEQAAFYFLQKADPAKRIYVRPTFQGAVAFMFMTVLFTERLLLLTVSILTGVKWASLENSISGVFLLAVVPYYRRISRSVHALSKQVKNFSPERAECFCCSHGHRHPDTQELIPCDRRLVEASICAWFGSLEDFRQFVLVEMRPKFKVEFCVPYRIALLVVMPVVWEQFGNFAWVLSTGNTENFAECLALYILTWVTAYPLVVECSLRASEFFRAKSKHWLLDIARTLAAVAVSWAFKILLTKAFWGMYHLPGGWLRVGVPFTVLPTLTLLVYGQRLLA